MFLVNTVEGRIVADEEIKRRIATQKPYGSWVAESEIELASLSQVPSLHSAFGSDHLVTLQKAFGYTEEELKLAVGAMAAAGEEPVGSMGIDVPLAVLSSKPQLLFGSSTSTLRR